MIINSKGFLPVIVLVVIVIAASAGTAAYLYYRSSHEQDRARVSDDRPDFNIEISQIQNELVMVLGVNGEISPERYQEVILQIDNLAVRGVPEDKIAEIRNLLSRVKLGGPRQELANNNAPIPQQNQKSPAVQPTLSPTPMSTQSRQQKTPAPTPSPSSPNSAFRTSPSGWFPPSTCSGSIIKFIDSPVNLSEINHITPMGQMASGHVTPTDHGYIHNNKDNLPVISDLRAPADGYIVGIGAFPRPNDYRIIIWHSCTISTIYIHAYELAPEILAKTGSLPPESRWEADQGPIDNRILPIPVKAGQVIGKIKGAVDFSVHDTSVILKFVNPALYKGEAWKIHTADMFGYFAEPLQSQLKEKSIRTVSPVGGKIDYDIDGRLVGSWFIEGTDYAGKGSDCTYYECHLAVAYDNVTPSLIRVSLPVSGIDVSLCNVCFGVYGVTNNGPDPADVGVDDGIVKYELVALKHSDTAPRLGVHISQNDSQALGVFMVQMLDNRRIKTEVFPGKSPGDVTAFTSKAKVYAR